MVPNFIFFYSHKIKRFLKKPVELSKKKKRRRRRRKKQGLFPRHWVFGDVWYIEVLPSLRPKLSQLDLWPWNRPMARRYCSLPAGVSQSLPRVFMGGSLGPGMHIAWDPASLCRGLLQALALLPLRSWAPRRAALTLPGLQVLACVASPLSH